MMKNSAENTVVIIPTGGTIASSASPCGAAPNASCSCDITNYTARTVRGFGYDCRVSQIFGECGIDSSDMSPREWGLISQTINVAAKEGVKKFLVIHGTDTMAYTTAWLSLTVPHDVTVVFTGSQKTSDEPDFDGVRNIEGAAHTLFAKKRGVYIHFDGKDFDGAFVTKEDAESFCAYTATGAGNLPNVNLSCTDFSPCTDWREAAENICVINLSPLFTYKHKDCKILLTVGYGTGNLPSRVIRAIADDYKECRARPVVICASACVKGTKNPCAYSGVGGAELVKHGFSVYSQGGYSCEFLIALSYLALTVDGKPENIIAQFLDKIE